MKERNFISIYIVPTRLVGFRLLFHIIFIFFSFQRRKERCNELEDRISDFGLVKH